MAKKEKKRQKNITPDAVALADELLHVSLSDVLRTVDGDGYAYVRLTSTGKGINLIPPKLESYVHLRYIDVSRNSITDISPFLKLPHVLTLNVANNHIEDITQFEDKSILQYCYLINLSGNKIKKLVSFGQQKLARLALDSNPIETLEDLEIPDSVTHLSLRGTKITSLENIPQNIISLYVSQTPLTSLEHVIYVHGLKTLDIDGVIFEDWSQFEILSQMLNLREISMTAPSILKNADHLRVEVIMRLGKLCWLNSKAITSQERKQALALKLARTKTPQSDSQSVADSLENDE